MAPAGISTDDWAGIRAAYDAGRHSVFGVDGGHRTRNPGQQWSTLFDGRGFSTTPDAGGWSWGLDLVSYGWGKDERDVALPCAVKGEGQRVAYTWDAQLTEWYVNDRRGLEHGYTVNTRPPDACGPLTLTLAIRGGLVPVISESRRDVRFVDAEHVAVLVYTGLQVLDADGRRLPASWGALPSGLRLSVEDRVARYPLTIDPIAQQAYLKASNTQANDRFGISVSVSGDTVVVGAESEDSSATGVNGNQADNSASSSGAAYVFVRSGAAWSQQAYLKASNTGQGDLFGSTVAISGDTIVVGAKKEDSDATGVNGDESNDIAFDSGASYVFVRTGTTWTQQAYLKASGFTLQEEFGWSVSVSGDSVVVGMPLESSSGLNSGGAYVFVRSGTIWSQQAFLQPLVTGGGDYFGYTVSLSGDTAVVGAPFEDSNATGVNGSASDNSAPDSGAAYVFVRSGTAWSQEAYIKASNSETGDSFGGSVSSSGDTAVVGALLEDSSATGVNGNESDNGAADSGAAYVFVRSGTSWSQEAYLKASNTQGSDNFGHAVSVSGDVIAAAARGEDSNATGMNGVQGDNSASDAGAAYVFARSGPNWSQQTYLKASNTGLQDRFGTSISVSGDTVVVGAPDEDSTTTGVNGDQSNNGAGSAGAAYVFDLAAPDPFSPSCFPGTGGVIACPCGQPPNAAGGCANFGATATTGAVLIASGNPSLTSDTIVLTTSNHRTAPTAGILNVFFTGQGSITNGTASNAGVRCVNTQLKRLYSGNTTAGTLSKPSLGMGDSSVSVRSAALGVGITAGQTRHYFNIYRDSLATTPCGSSTANTNLTNAGSITWVP